MQPLLFSFRTMEEKKFQIIYKAGDNLRQDQLVIQLISLMNHLLCKGWGFNFCCDIFSFLVILITPLSSVLLISLPSPLFSSCPSSHLCSAQRLFLYRTFEKLFFLLVLIIFRKQYFFLNECHMTIISFILILCQH